ncbi:hypothetical protein, partial [Bradyrhizobium japonicum]|uniref:hypothetical protein n=1 Tax=Bradyrhizobium japonicum TaxID=375 RepID=UPI001AEC2F83
MPMHHRQTLTEHMHAGEVAGVEDRRALVALKECQPKEHDDLGAELQGMGYELAGILEGRIRDNRLHANRKLPFQKEVPVRGVLIGRSVVNQIGGVDLMSGRSESADDHTGAASWLPNDLWQLLHAQQGVNRLWRALMSIGLQI